MENDLENRVKTVMSQVFNVPVEMINEASTPDSIDGWDSLKHLSLVVALEEEFDVQLDDEQMMEMMDYSSIVNVLSKK